MSNSSHYDLFMRSAIEWIADNTNLDVNPEDPDAFDTLPARAQLFAEKFSEMMHRTIGVTSQSIEGLSQSFDASADISSSVWALARALLSPYLKSQVRVFPAQRRW